ncbi:hypothetical protein BGZ79_008671 [Entomortierella chlamydospora]|nr:hypothetical protein BGZ79_008671 [Entomortierella chlamydospora]
MNSTAHSHIYSATNDAVATATTAARIPQEQIQDQGQSQDQDQDHSKEHVSYSDSRQQPIASNLAPFSQETLTSIIGEDDRDLLAKIYSKIEHLSEAERLQSQLVILYSDTLCPILKYHAELFSEIVRVVPSTIAGRLLHDAAICNQIKQSELAVQPPNILAIVISPKPDNHIKMTLAEPLQLDLFDRKRMIDIQVENTPYPLRKLLLVDDSWARLNIESNPTISCQSPDAHRERCVQSLTEECSRMENILTAITATPNLRIGPMELVCVLDQSESELYGVPVGIRGKVIFVVSKDREERPKAVTLKTCMHWIDRIFLKSDYSLDWIRANVIPLYVDLPDGPKLNLACQRPESAYEGVRIRLSSKRPVEAHTRVKVRQGRGAEVLESSVLEEIERTKIFEMQAIRKPLFFLYLMGNMSLDNNLIIGGGSKIGRDDDLGTRRDIIEESNPFL